MSQKPTIPRRGLLAPNLQGDAATSRKDSEDEVDLLTSDLDDPAQSKVPVPDSW